MIGFSQCCSGANNFLFVDKPLGTAVADFPEARFWTATDNSACGSYAKGNDVMRAKPDATVSILRSCETHSCFAG